MKEKNDAVEVTDSIDRRDFIIKAGALGIGALAVAAGGEVFAETAETGKKSEPVKKGQAMLDATFDCLKTGQACIDHCLDMFKAGDTTLANCAESVTEMMAFCTAHVQLISYRSKHLKAMCELAILVCEDCEKECRKHEKDHDLCRKCAEACAACIKECKAFLGKG
ncbi:MAG: four-helix bundle copper-binding protein [Deltaproteobacteria bacterium]|nr:four-helix bundle copper-binding protein [Deltaproteobacteria bacterium]